MKTGVSASSALDPGHLQDRGLADGVGDHDAVAAPVQPLVLGPGRPGSGPNGSGRGSLNSPSLSAQPGPGLVPKTWSPLTSGHDPCEPSNGVPLSLRKPPVQPAETRSRSVSKQTAAAFSALGAELDRDPLHGVVVARATGP